MSRHTRPIVSAFKLENGCSHTVLFEGVADGDDDDQTLLAELSSLKQSSEPQGRAQVGGEEEEEDDDTLAQVSVQCGSAGLLQDLSDIARATDRLEDIIDTRSSLSGTPSRGSSRQRSVSPLVSASLASSGADVAELDSEGEENSQVD